MAKFKVEAKKIRQVLRKLEGMSEDIWRSKAEDGGYAEGKAEGFDESYDLLLKVLPSKYRP